MSSARSSERWARAVDPLIFTGLFVAYLVALVATAGGLGYARDEGFYFHAAATYGKWFEVLLQTPGRALEQGVVDRFWRENHEHPALMKSLFWASQRSFEGWLFSERGTALRFPAMVISALGVATTFAFGRRCIGRAGGIVAALAFGLMPPVFYHSHLACFDMPIAAMWLFVVYAYHRSLKPSLPWALACAVLYGLALDTKHNAWYLPPALIAHAVALHLVPFVRRVWGHGAPVAAAGQESARGVKRPPVPWAIGLMLLLGPLVFYALWPWIWNDTWRRLGEYAQFHLQHVYYNMEYLGTTYFRPPFPRSYAWLMTFATVPTITIVLALCGGLSAARAVWVSIRGRLASEPGVGAPARGASPPAHDWALLWLFCLVLSYSPWLLDTTPIFGGTKHWLNAYPFLALFAGQGFVWLVDAWRARAGASISSRLAPWALGACTMVAPLVETVHSHPWGLSAYTPLVGGAPGAATLGLNRSFWGYTTGSVVSYLNQSVGKGQRLFVHDTAHDSFRMLQKDGRLRRDIKPWFSVSGSHHALYHHEQHMSRVEHMIWVDYGTTSPAHVATYDGVPMIWVYDRNFR
jgi:hypothetical protein